LLALIDGDVLLHATLWETTNEQAALDKLRYNIEDYTDGAFCNDCVIAVGPPDGKNYRDDLYPEYKQIPSRVTGRKARPPHFQKVKEYLYSLEQTVVADNIEADDLLGILSRQLGDDCVIVTVDKDMDQLAGRHYNPKWMKERYYIVNEEQADRFFLEQLLKGDPIDKIPGLPKCGPMKAAKILETAKTVAEAASLVLDEYFLTYDKDWESYFLANGKLLWLQRKDYDWFTLETFKERFLNASTGIHA
jgi:5'-3' exonuclease